jgi:hypothetical protein
MTSVMKVSKQTYEVLTTENSNLSFNSELATHSIYNIVTVSKSSATTSVTYSHNLGFVPKVWIFLDTSDISGNFYRRIPCYVEGTDQSLDYYINSSQIVIQSSASGTVYGFRVIIFTRSPNP